MIDTARQSSIIVAEPTYADGEHATVNSAILQAIGSAFGPAVFAATPLHHAWVREAADAAAPALLRKDITVAPSGGVNIHRMRVQWRALDGLVRDRVQRTLVLLSAGPETLLVARALVARYSRLRLFAVMHGNLASVVGWRSRDPRRRLIDLRSALSMARHPRIRLILLEPHIRAAAAEAGLPHDFLVWPHPSPMHERPPPAPWIPGPRLRLAFVGTGNRAKGFDDFLALHRSAPAAYDWTLVGRLDADYSPAEAIGIEHASERLSRTEFLRQVRRADFAIIAFREDYRLIASGSLLDCVAQRTPIIAVTNPMLAALARQYGPIGYLCADLAAAMELLTKPSRLQDRSAYNDFQQTLDAIQRDRAPEALARIVRRDLAS